MLQQEFLWYNIYITKTNSPLGSPPHRPVGEHFYHRKVVMSKLSNLNEPVKDGKLELIKELKSKIKEDI